jgi:periplasmic protein CpxP/Spy
MEKTKLLTIAVIGLLVINFGTLAFLLLNGKGHRPPHGGRPEPKYEIIERLHFDAAQQKQYDKLIDWHQANIGETDDKIREAKNKLYSQLSKPTVDLKAKDSLIAVINLSQKKIEEIHFRHFEDIKKLCHKDQLDDFNALSEGLARLFAPKHHRSGHD